MTYQNFTQLPIDPKILSAITLN